MTNVADILGPWWDIETEDGRDSRRLPQFLHDLGDSVPWRDVTAQAAEIIPPSPGLCVWRVWVDDAQLLALVEHPAYEVLRAGEADANCDPAEWPATLERPAEDDGAFPLLPDSGWLEAGSVYQHGNGAVIVRQSHSRTHYAPAETPNLFIVYRPDAAGVLEWVVGESVLVGTQRTYGGVTYAALQAHVTQSDWTPPATPALWSVVVAPSPNWTAGVAYKIGDIVTYNGALYECRQSHTAQVGWEPPNVLALWLPV
jgi:hypothetical protein